MQWLDRGVWPVRGVQAGNATGIIAGRERKGQWGQVGHSRLRAGDCAPVGSNSEPERSGRQGLSSILLFLCKTAVSEFETPLGDFWTHCCCGFIKGAQVENRSTAGPAHVPTGNESHRGSWAHRLQGTSVLRTGLPPSSHLLVRGPGTPILAPPPRAWILGQLRGIARPSCYFTCLGVRMSKKVQLADYGGLSVCCRCA